MNEITLKAPTPSIEQLEQYLERTSWFKVDTPLTRLDDCINHWRPPGDAAGVLATLIPGKVAWLGDGHFNRNIQSNIETLAIFEGRSEVEVYQDIMTPPDTRQWADYPQAMSDLKDAVFEAGLDITVPDNELYYTRVITPLGEVVISYQNVPGEGRLLVVDHERTDSTKIKVEQHYTYDDHPGKLKFSSPKPGTNTVHDVRIVTTELK